MQRLVRLGQLVIVRAGGIVLLGPHGEDAAGHQDAADRLRRPLVVYGAIEVGIAAVGLAIPALCAYVPAVDAAQVAFGFWSIDIHIGSPFGWIRGAVVLD